MEVIRFIYRKTLLHYIQLPFFFNVFIYLIIDLCVVFSTFIRIEGAKEECMSRVKAKQ